MKNTIYITLALFGIIFIGCSDNSGIEDKEYRTIGTFQIELNQPQASDIRSDWIGVDGVSKKVSGKRMKTSATGHDTLTYENPIETNAIQLISPPEYDESIVVAYQDQSIKAVFDSTNASEFRFHFFGETGGSSEYIENRIRTNTIVDIPCDSTFSLPNDGYAYINLTGTDNINPEIYLTLEFNLSGMVEMAQFMLGCSATDPSL